MLIVFLSIVIATWYFISLAPKHFDKVEKKEFDTTIIPEDTIIRKQSSLSKKEITEKLKALAESKSLDPEKLSKGAMCYSMAAPPNRVEYICPICNEKTLYMGKYAYQIEKDVQAARGYVKTLQQYDIQFDETEFCKKCQKNKTENPSMALIINYTDEKQPRIIKPVTAEDMQILTEFLKGTYIHQASQGREVPLKDYLWKLSNMLGVEMINK